MYIPWSNASLKRAIQITGNLSKIYERLQAHMQLTHQEILQVKQELDELKARAEVPGAIDMYQKYDTLLNPYLQSYELDSRTPLVGDQKVVCQPHC